MKAFLYICALLLAFCGGILCTSCRTSKPTPPPAVASLSPRQNTTPLEAPITEPSAPGLLAKIWPFKQDEKKPSESTAFLNPTQTPRKCKGCTIVYSAGPATVTTTTVGKKATAATAEGATATAIGKAKGPTAIGDSATATDNTKAGQRGGAAATATGATATATTEKNGIPWWLWLIIAGLGGYGAVRLYKRFTPV